MDPRVEDYVDSTCVASTGGGMPIIPSPDQMCVKPQQFPFFIFYIA